MTVKLSVSNIAQRRGQSPREEQLFKDISFTWEAPGIHVIMGGSGSGKTSLLKSMGGVWEPSGGRVVVSEVELWNSSIEAEQRVLSTVGFAFQNNALFSSMRVIENLTFPHRQRFPEIDEKARNVLAQKWLKEVGLEQAAMQFPHELSGGMQKRLAIARTLILDPDIVFFDDPTAGLDPITSRQIADLIGNLMKGKNSLVIIVTNDKFRAQGWSKNIHFLWKGKLHSPGSKEYAKISEYYL